MNWRQTEGWSRQIFFIDSHSTQLYDETQYSYRRLKARVTLCFVATSLNAYKKKINFLQETRKGLFMDW